MHTYHVTIELQDTSADNALIAPIHRLTYDVDAGDESTARWNAWMKFRHVIRLNLPAYNVPEPHELYVFRIAAVAPA